MGLFLIGIMAIGVVGGLLVDTLLLGIVAMALVKIAQRRRNAWPVAGVSFVAGTLFAITVVALFPYEYARPGSDYDIVAFNIFVQGFGYTASIGVGAIAAVAVAMFCPTASIDAGDVNLNDLAEPAVPGKLLNL